jgi:hypothetical protein
MRLYGQAIPLDGGGYVVTVVCPNRGSFERLMVEVSRIEADAFAPEIALRDGHSATGASNATHVVEQPEAPALTPEQEAMLAATESRDADQPEDMGLNVGIHLSPAVDTGD